MPTAIAPSEAAQQILDRREARRGLIDFCTFTLPDYDPAEHLQTIADKLEAVERGEVKRLMIFSHPRSGKSELASIRFPAWYLGRHRQDQVIGCSYAEGLAYSNSFAVRETITDPRYQRLWDIGLATSGAIRWQIEGKDNNRASYIAAGVGGGITGEGANLLIIDDPVKNKEEADSVVSRDRAWNWYRTVARTRLQPDAAIVLIMTRWHKDDLAGRILKLAAENPQADQWEVLHLRAIEDGQALWPARYPVSDLENIRSTIGSRDFAALYQGDPVQAEGNIIKREWWKYYNVRDEYTRLVQSWDTAFKSGQGNDYSVCSLWGESDSHFDLIDVWRGRVEFPELERAVVSAYDRDKPSAVLIEDAASGQSLIQSLKKRTKLPIKPVKVDRDKTARVNAVTPLIEAGRVRLPARARWLHDFIAEVSAFPNGEHDDQVDTMTQALTYMAGRPEKQVLFV